ncbi:hypothetical protein VF21_06008 [Pseudogymnoascus sp. 05NY08]|nr:hypothetical protein VF21_06008 [Pseudogymnoascus sp. 05NY08]
MTSIDYAHNLAAARAPTMAAATPPQGSNAAPNNQTPGHPSFRRCVRDPFILDPDPPPVVLCMACDMMGLTSWDGVSFPLPGDWLSTAYYTRIHIYIYMPDLTAEPAPVAHHVRCDAASLGVPCTNCVAFSIECKIPTPKRKKTQAATAGSTRMKDSDSDRGDTAEAPSPGTESLASVGYAAPPPHSSGNFVAPSGTPTTQVSESQARQAEQDEGIYLHFMKPKFSRAPIKEAGRVAYLGESSNLTLLVHDRHGSADVVHYPLPDNIRGARSRLTDLDDVEIDILHQRGAFLLPPRSLCDELVESYFKWVAPIVPVINRTRFMKQYQDPKNPPSLLLLQSMLLAGSRVCVNPQLMDSQGSTTPAAMTFYKRAKALYDANYEDDRVTIVQALVLMGWYWEGPEDVTRNVFYWSRVATIVAQGSGMHRSVDQSQLSATDKKLWKRIWWTLFTRDRSVAVALGRPVHINTDDSDVDMLCEEDFIEEEDDTLNPLYPPDQTHVQFFLQYVKLCEIMGLVLSQQYSVASKARRQNAIDLTHSDMALADWLQNCPKDVYWEPTRHQFWSALLHSNYYTTLCLLHRAHMPPASSTRGGFPEDSAYPSRNIAFQAAGMITSIIANLRAHNELQFAPAFMVYSLFSALIMHVYQNRSSVPAVQQQTQERIRICMDGLKDVSRVWVVAKMVYTLFESILGNKVLEERLQKAAGKRHKKTQQTWGKLHTTAQQQQDQQQRPSEDAKRKYDDMALDFAPPNGLAPQESYERSRPQTPARETAPMGAPPSVLSPRQQAAAQLQQQQQGQAQDTFMGGTSSRPHTRPPTPFNPSFSVPATPPDLYLVTRNSPSISQALWENFQPDHLFPEGSGVVGMQNSPPPPPGAQQWGSPSAPMGPGGRMGSMGSQGGQGGQGDVGMGGLYPPGNVGAQWGGMGGGQGGFEAQGGQGQSPSESWSSATAVPATLNVEDWFQFFGINGDLSGMNAADLLSAATSSVS